MRLDRYLSGAGFGSRKDVKKHIAGSHVTVNGSFCSDPGQSIGEGDDVRVDGADAVFKRYVYIMLNKPAGYISALKDKKEKTVADLIGNDFKRRGLSCAGRLDKDTEGMMILTNDGMLVHDLISPSKNVPKKYYVEAVGDYTRETQQSFNRGIRLEDGYVTRPSMIELLNEGGVKRFYVTITDGRYHQVKRMFGSQGMKVKYLKRISIGSVELDNSLQPGEYRELNVSELGILKSIKDGR